MRVESDHRNAARSAGVMKTALPCCTSPRAAKGVYNAPTNVNEMTPTRRPEALEFIDSLVVSVEPTACSKISREISVVESNSNTGSKKNAMKSMRDKEKIDVFKTLI